jgi:ribosome-interacting GTPase 1
VKTGGGLSFNSTVPLTNIDEKMVRNILHEYRIFNAEVLFRCDATVDEFIDVVEGNRSYIRCIYIYNKIDQLSIEELEEFARKPDSIVVRYTYKLQ